MTLKNPVYKKLEKILGKEHITRAEEDLVCYAYDAASKSHLPDVILFPENVEQVSSILRLAGEEGLYVIPRGYGSGMTGGAVAVNGGAVLVMTRFNRILHIDKNNLTAHVEPEPQVPRRSDQRSLVVVGRGVNQVGLDLASDVVHAPDDVQDPGQRARVVNLDESRVALREPQGSIG